MPRVKIVSQTGRVVAKGLYRLPHVELLCSGDSHELVPVGSYAARADLIRLGWMPRPNDCIYLNRQDIFELPRSQQWVGCCGPSGEQKNVLDPDTSEPIAYEFTDCWASHYIRFEEGDFTVEEISPEEPQCMVGYVRFKGERLLVGAACGRNEQEALKRLMPVCEQSLRREASYTSQSHQILRLKIETDDASAFLQKLKGKRPDWLIRKY